ncbi:ABC transporter ATP-binding protein [Novosphingobium beihaiensis]|uniref:ABC transporter ATP-binding protein n=1 Tax=Novosphingobium beihaiensis TaxID=2930389 RepID=A0ABT0BUP6_9SPHN|nr:ABC transporter ATP-binding protein [Novosphingobium beihaiensis]MCJ2188771.1 ABC transporter ATP-binding protein [Novosphingobium beihaiensis]
MSLQTLDLGVDARIAGLTLTFHLGEVTAICGPNGAGKSTLLSCLAGLVPPDTGHIAFGGKPMESLRHDVRARAIGYLPQSPEVAWDLSVEVLVALGRLPWRNAGRGEAQAAVDEAIAAMDLDAFRHRRVSQLSGGERARALMARVLATEPSWLLADEPLASLDLAHAASLVRRFREQSDLGRGVVLVLHDLAMAMNHADRVIVLDKGSLAADGAPEFALGSEVVERVWGCPARWVGEPGARALSVG